MNSIPYPGICSYLIYAGACVNKVNLLGDNALHWAIKIGKSASVSILIAAGANFNVTNAYGENAIFLMMREKLDEGIFPPITEDFKTCLAQSSEIESCQQTLAKNHSLAVDNWKDVLNKRNLPKETPVYHIVESKIYCSEMQTILHLFDYTVSKALMYLESSLGLRNVHTLQILKKAIQDIKDIDAFVIVVTFFLDVINTTPDYLFFAMWVDIVRLSIDFRNLNFFHRVVALPYKMWGNVLKSLITHVENVSNRILCMDYAGRLSKTFKAKSYSIMVLELISMMAEECWENWDPTEQCIVKFIAQSICVMKKTDLFSTYASNRIILSTWERFYLAVVPI